MADEAHERTDKILKRLERNVKKEYSIAVRDMSAKLQEYLEKDEIKRLEQEKLLKAGQITKKEYQDWCFRHQMMGKRWEDMLNVLSEDMHHTNEIALSMAKDKMPDIYALNMNYGTYEIEHGGRIDTGFTLYNHDTAEYLLGDQRQLMPKPSPQRAKQIAANKDLQWNKKKIQSAVLQGVLQGENPHKVAERLRSVGQMNYNSSVRYARTMGTSAQNAGRYESYRRAKRLGVDLTIEWSATLDGRTRHDHRLMHGQRTEVDEPFHTPDGFTIYYPADCTGNSDAPQKEIWNCRCTLKAWVKGYEGETVKSSPKMGDMTYEEWRGEKEPKKTQVLSDTFQNTKGLADDYKKGFTAALNNCYNDDAKKLYSKFADELVAVRDKKKSGAHFSRFDGGISFNAKNDISGSSYQAPYEVGFHEFGHMIDWLANGKTAQYLSNTELNGQRLEEVIKSDFKAFKNSLGVSKASEVVASLRDEQMSLLERGNISDILEKCTGQSYPLGVGHGKNYHKRSGATEREFFTEVLSSSVVNEASYKQMKRLFPNAVDMVWALVRSKL